MGSMWPQKSPRAGATGPSINAVTSATNWPWGICVAPNDDVYVADTNNARIIRLDPVTHSPILVAGNGIAFFSGDGLSATLAELNGPQGVAVDTAGNIFIADTGNARVRRVDASTHYITTFAGTGTTGGAVVDGVPATTSEVDSPGGLAVDAAGNVYIADTWHHRIRKVTTDGIIHTIAGSTSGFAPNGPALSAQLYLPHGIWVDPSGTDVIFTDNGTHAVCWLNGGTIVTVAGGAGQGYANDGGPATLAQMDNPQGIAMDSSGNIYIADCYNNAIRMLRSSDSRLVTIAGSLGPTHGDYGDGGPASLSLLYAPSAVAVDSTGKLYIADTGNMRIRSIP
jgi:DNA-binding beta-propeller fold protein YncE